MNSYKLLNKRLNITQPLPSSLLVLGLARCKFPVPTLRGISPSLNFRLVAMYKKKSYDEIALEFASSLLVVVFGQQTSKEERKIQDQGYQGAEKRLPRFRSPFDSRSSEATSQSSCWKYSGSGLGFNLQEAMPSTRCPSPFWRCPASSLIRCRSILLSYNELSLWANSVRISELKVKGVRLPFSGIIGGLPAVPA